MNAKLILGVLLLAAVAVVPAMAQPDTVWTKVYGGLGNEQIHAMGGTWNGGVGIFGTFTSSGDSSYQGLLQLNANGDSLWTYVPPSGGWGSPSVLFAERIAFAKCTNIYNGELRFVVLSSHGEPSTDRSYRGIGDFPQRPLIRQCADGGYAIAASNNNNADSKLLLLRLNSLGDSLWYHEYPSDYQFSLVELVPAGDAFYLIGEETFDDQSDLRFLKLDADGGVIWNRYGQELGLHRVHGIWPAPDGGLQVLGYSDSTRFGLISPEGNFRAVSPYVQIDYSKYGMPPFRLRSGAFVFFGSDWDVNFLRMTGMGVAVWEMTFGDQGDEDIRYITQANDGGIVAGILTDSFYQGRFRNKDIWVVKFAAVENTVEPPVSLPQTVVLLSSYPNPFNSRAVIEYRLDAPGFVRLGLFDLSGRLVEGLGEGMSFPGTHRITLDAGSLPSGSYQLKLATPSGVRSSRVALIK